MTKSESGYAVHPSLLLFAILFAVFLSLYIKFLKTIRITMKSTKLEADNTELLTANEVFELLSYFKLNSE